MPDGAVALDVYALLRARARPDQLEGRAVVIFKQVGIDGIGETRVVEHNRVIIAASA